ncbi:uncharacterized protein LOC8260082 isoform X2 [Ricinus communis]|uniref:uncharacterized protein LOC8260082 isoform X2 n=1 Tax=Ricinus communis TaxID=3988 RepID=UPI00201A83F4|nr:uncharacterized protein LOC8260082 isoform X2 [Ricinus communis]
MFMSSPPSDNLHLVNHNFSNPLETSDTLWQCLQENNMLSLPIEDHNSIGSFNCRWPFSQESSISSHAAEFTRNVSEWDTDLLLGEEFSGSAMSSINEGIPGNILHYQKDRNFFNNLQVPNDPWPSLGEGTVGDLDPNMPLEQEKFSLAKARSDEELIESTVLNDCQDNNTSLPLDKDNLRGTVMDTSAIGDQENTSLDKSNKEKGLRGKRVIKKKEIKHRFRRILTEKLMVQPNAEEGSTSKKQQHNAKEKVRRMKLNASYLALGSLLSNSRRSKKRWTAPVIVDKVLEYIPELQSEIEELILKKNSMVSKIKNEQAIQHNASVELQAPTVSVHEVKHGELIIQICMQTDQDKGLSILMQNLEAESMVISSASSIGVCDDRICYHVHIQMNGNPLAADYVALRKKLISWLKNDS